MNKKEDEEWNRQGDWFVGRERGTGGAYNMTGKK